MVIGKITKEQVLKDLKEKLTSGEITLEEITSLKPEVPEVEEPKEPEKVEELASVKEEPEVAPETPTLEAKEPVEEKTEEVEEVKEGQSEQIVPEVDYKAEIEELKKTNEALNARMSALEEKILKGADFGARVVSNPSQESPQKHILAGHGSYDY